MRTIITALICLSFALPAAAMPVCGNGKRTNCVVDGDTVWISGEKIRLLEIDTPEMGQPKCNRPAPLAGAARDRLAQLLTGDIRMDRSGQDRYGRTLANLNVGGRDVGDVLLQEGLARAYHPGQDPWCN